MSSPSGLDRDHEHEVFLTAVDDLEVAVGRDDSVFLPAFGTLRDCLADFGGRDSAFHHPNPRVAAEEDPHEQCSTLNYICITNNTHMITLTGVLAARASSSARGEAGAGDRNVTGPQGTRRQFPR